METRSRSSRSRSKTPLLILSENSHKESYASEEVVMRKTRSSVRTSKIATSNNRTITNESSNFDFYSDEPIKSKNEKVARKTRYKTSDYSSEDGENLVSSTLISDQNISNQFLEDSRRSHSRASESSHTSAYEYYKAAGDYWNKFPKTDYTYSRNSRHRTEIAPGVVAMPNMSRRSLHSSNSSLEEYIVSNKQSNTDFQDRTDVVDYTASSPQFLENFSTARYRVRSDYHSTPIPKTVTYQESLISRIYTSFKTIILTFFRLIYTAIYYILGQNVVLLWLEKLVYKLILNIMIIDTWLLKHLNHRNKFTRSLALCFIPFLILTGWWLFFGRIPFIHGNSGNATETFIESSTLTTKTDFNNLFESSIPSFDGNVLEKVVTIREKVFVEPPNANEIASQLTPQQLEEIASLIQSKVQHQQLNDDFLVQKVLRDSNIQNIFIKLSTLTEQLENYRPQRSVESGDGNDNDLNLEVENLRDDIYAIKADIQQLRGNYDEAITKMMADLRAESAQYNARFKTQLNRCCRNSFIQMENYVTKVLKNLLAAPSHLSTPKDISDWLHSTFIAKQELESTLANLTQHLQANFNGIVENNGQVVMDQIVAKITTELDSKINKLTVEKNEAVNDLKINSLTDDYVKRIVRDSLAVYDADKTGLVDYALESAGGHILSTRCTESYSARTAVVSIFGLPLWYPVNSPRTVITPSMVPGECWAFQNFPGFVLVKLAAPIKVEAFSIEHISKLLAPNRKIDSAPKEFAVYGLRNETDNDPLLLGTYVYDDNGQPLQYFAASIHDLILEIIELRIYSNHGNPNYTCLYRFRVHGRLPT